MKVYFVLLIPLLFGCKRTSNDSTYEIMIDKIPAITGKSIYDYNAIFIVPFYGCAGCISSAERFLIQDYLGADRKGIFFVVTGHDSEKSVRLRLGDEAVSHPDVFIDIKGDFSEYVAQYPVLLELNHGQVISVSEANGENPGVYSDLLQLTNSI